MHGAYLT